MSEIVAKEYWAKKGDVDLYVYRKTKGEPRKGDGKPVFFLIHGSSFSGPSGFDLTVPGKGEYSFMDRFAEWGFDVWTVDHEGYGRSSRTESNSNLKMAVDDLKAATDIVARETGQTSYAFYGQSSGAIRAALFAEHHPDRVSRVILDAFVYTGKDAPTLIKRREKLDQWRSSNMRPVDRDFYHSIFNRDKPGTSEEGVADALADAELKLASEVPTGTYLDMCAHLPVNDPKKIQCPVLIVRGEHDGIATEEDLINYFMELPVKDKQFVIVPGLAHVAPLGKNRHIFWHLVHQFLTTPERRN